MIHDFNFNQCRKLKKNTVNITRLAYWVVKAVPDEIVERKFVHWSNEQNDPTEAP